MFLALFLHILIHVIFSLNSTELHFSFRMCQLQHALFGKKILHCFLYIKSNVIMNDISVFPKASLINQQQISILQYEVYLMPSLIPSLTSWSGKNMTSIVANVTHILDVAEILQPLIQWVSQKFCNHSKQSECTRNSATFYTLDLAEFLGPFIHWVLQKFCDHSYTGCSRNSTTIHTLDVAEIPRPFTHKGVAEILGLVIHWVLQKFRNHS